MTHLRHLIGFLFGILTCASAWAQTPEQLANLEPGELYYQAWSLTKDAEDLETRGDFIGAFTKYRKAQTFFDIVKVSHPAYKPDMVRDRSEMTTASMEKIHEKALAQQGEQQAAGTTPLLELPGQVKPKLVIPETLSPNSAQATRIQQLRDEIDRLQAQLANSPNQRDANAALLRQKILGLQQDLNRLVSAPLRNDVAELHRQINQLRRERDAMALARDQAVAAQLKTLRQLEETQNQLDESHKEEQRLLAVIEKQTKINGQVVEGQQEQIDALRKSMAEKDKLMAEVRKKNKDLEVQLAQSQTMVSELQAERDTLIAEKNQMAALLQMNEADRIQGLITQNVGLSKELNERTLELKLVQDDANSTKENILEAKQALTVAKARILNLQKENTQANIGLKQMKTRLKQAEDDLLAQLNGGELNIRGQEEVAVLRKVAAKFKAKIAAQEGAAALLIDQANRMGADDAVMKKAMALMNGDEKMVLTDEEESFLDRTTEGVNFNNVLRPSQQVYDDATSRLRSLTDDLNGVAHRLFAKGDFQAARGNLELIVDEDPGAWEAMVNLGIIHLRLDDPSSAAQQFRQSILVAGNRKVPFAHFLLGETLYRTELYEEAEEQLRRSLSFEPENAKAHVFLGSICGLTNRLEDAGFHFKEALAQDPNLWEPYMNLAILYLNQGKLELAREHYTESLRKGAPARPSLAAKLGL
ncbi:tetratricopeptide repeat protein [Verrucomicrobiaceae bacterium 227]